MTYNPRINEINEELNKLSLRRNVIEKRIEFRLQTMDKFNELHEQSKQRLYEQTWKQNEEARQRNHNLLRQIGAVNGSLKARPAIQGKSSAAIQLEHAKKSYLSFSSKLYPTWKEQTTIKKLSLLNKLQAEKEDAEKRRLKTLYHLKHEHDIRSAVEDERRQLLLALSLEQRDQLEASAKLHLLKDRGKAVESELQSQFQAFGDQYERYLAEASTRSLQDAHNLLTPLFSIPNDSSELLTEIIDPRRPGLQGRLASTKNNRKYYQNEQKQQKNHPQYQDSLQRRHQNDDANYEDFDNQEGYDQNVNNNMNESIKSQYDGSNIQPYQNLNYSNSLHSSREYDTNITNNTLPLNNTIFESNDGKNYPNNSPLPSPSIMIETEKQSATLPPKPPLRKEISTFSKNDLDITSNSSSSPHPIQLQPNLTVNPSIITNIPSTSQSLPQETATVQKINTTEKIENSPRTPKSSTGIQNNTQNIDSISSQNVVDISTNPSIQPPLSPTKNNISIKRDENVIVDEVENDNNRNNINNRDNSLNDEKKIQSSTDTSHNIISNNENNNSNKNSESKNKNEDGSINENSNNNTNSNNNNNDNNITNDDDGDNNDDNIDEIIITDSLPPRDISIILQAICTYIEKLEEPLIVKKSYYNATMKSPQITSKNIHKILDLISLNEIETLEDKSNPIPPEVFTWIVLKIAEEKGSYLLPSEILNGVVSVDKLTKSHKKLGGGRTEIWTNFMNHFRKITELKRITQEEISKFVTTSFIVHMDDADKTRNERKVMKLVQLSILPPEKEIHSRPPTPQRKFGPPPDLSSTPPGTPNYSERPNSAGSMTSISAPPSPLLSFTAPPAPQPNKFSQRIVERPDMPQFSGLSNQFLSNNSRQSTETNMGIAAKRPSYEGTLSSGSNNSTSLANKILKAATAFKHDDDEIEDDEEILSPQKSNPVVLKDLSTAADDEFDF